ncbi:MAG: sigma-70 family RNA polymerase sigma factor, partial [Pseudomonadota bacterium]
ARPILLTIIRNLSFDWHRRRRVEFETLEPHRILQDAPHDSERIVAARQELELVVRALEQMPPRTLLAFRYCRVNGHTLKEAGQRLGVSGSRVSQLVSDAIIRILDALDGDWA